MKPHYGWSEQGKFVMLVTDEQELILHRISLTLEEMHQISTDWKEMSPGQVNTIPHDQLP